MGLFEKKGNPAGLPDATFLTPMGGAAAQLNEMLESFVAAGFSREESMQLLITAILAGGMMGGQ